MTNTDAALILISAGVLLCRQRFLSGILFFWVALHIELFQLYEAHNTWAFLQFWCISSFIVDFILALLCSVKNKNFAAFLIYLSALIHLIIFYFAKDRIYIISEWRSYLMLFLSAGLIISAIDTGACSGGNRKRFTFFYWSFDSFFSSSSVPKSIQVRVQK